jgi:hypothetical protein
MKYDEMSGGQLLICLFGFSLIFTESFGYLQTHNMRERTNFLFRKLILHFQKFICFLETRSGFLEIHLIFRACWFSGKSYRASYFYRYKSKYKIYDYSKSTIFKSYLDQNIRKTMRTYLKDKHSNILFRCIINTE